MTNCSLHCREPHPVEVRHRVLRRCLATQCHPTSRCTVRTTRRSAACTQDRELHALRVPRTVRHREELLPHPRSVSVSFEPQPLECRPWIRAHHEYGRRVARSTTTLERYEVCVVGSPVSVEVAGCTPNLPECPQPFRARPPDARSSSRAPTALPASPVHSRARLVGCYRETSAVSILSLLSPRLSPFRPHSPARRCKDGETEEMAPAAIFHRSSPPILTQLRAHVPPLQAVRTFWPANHCHFLPVFQAHDCGGSRACTGPPFRQSPAPVTTATSFD